MPKDSPPASIRNQLLIGIVGPTAVGKSAVAVALAERLGGELISCDSMQLYQGMDIGTSKPSAELRRRVPHHLVSLIPPSEEFSCAQFREVALRVIEEIQSRGRVPIIVGGTGLYLRALLDGIFPGVAAHPDVRERLAREAEERGIEGLHQRLQQCDPQAAAKILPRDLRRIVRALEVFEVTGEPISRWWQRTEPLDERYEIQLFGLRRPQPELYRRIDQRVEEMFRAGLVDEVQQVLASQPSKTAMQALGYKEVARHLGGEMTLDEAIALVKQNTRRYAKRQMTWFKKDHRIHWSTIEDGKTPEEIAGLILSRVTCSSPLLRSSEGAQKSHLPPEGISR